VDLCLSLVANGKSKLRRIDGWRKIATVFSERRGGGDTTIRRAALSPPLVRELHRVHEQIPHDLLQARRVTDNRACVRIEHRLQGDSRTGTCNERDYPMLMRAVPDVRQAIYSSARR
jgi:hypothetical protein